jgi:hypothetical protein
VRRDFNFTTWYLLSWLTVVMVVAGGWTVLADPFAGVFFSCSPCTERFSPIIKEQGLCLFKTALICFCIAHAVTVTVGCRLGAHPY